MAHHWQFKQDDQNQWHWTRLDAVEQPIETSTGFESQTRCVLDAVRYAVGRRRSQTRLDDDGSSHQTH